MLVKDFTRAAAKLLLTAALLVTTAGAGAAAQSGVRAACPMSRKHGCCKMTRKNRRAPGAAPVRLCCVQNVPQPAPSNPNFNVQSSPGAATTPRPSAEQAPTAAALPQPREYAPPFLPSHSPPAYLRHAAFLI